MKSDDLDPRTFFESKTKAGIRREALQLWWERPNWPCVILSVDPGTVAGCTITLSIPEGGLKILRAEVVKIHRDRLMEAMLAQALEEAESRDLPLVAALEEWGKGGPRGLVQWIGLGEARGPWRRQLSLLASQCDKRIFNRSRTCLVNQNRWRSRVIKATGTFDENGKWKKFDPEGWKKAAYDTAQSYFIDQNFNFGNDTEDVAEAACISVYASRSDEVLSKIPKNVLNAYGISQDHTIKLEPYIRYK